MSEKFKLVLSDITATVVPPVTGGLVGIYSIMQQMQIIISIITVLFGLIWGYRNFKKRDKLMSLQIQEIEDRINKNKSHAEE